MQKLTIKNFGPINNLDIDINDFMLFVGPQASGKSTIAKTIFFFKSISNDIINFLIEYIKSNGQTQITILSIRKIISKKFLDYFGPSVPLQGMELIYYYTDQSWLKITLEKTHSYVTPDFSDNILQELGSLIKQTKLFAKNNKSFSAFSINDFIRKNSDLDAYISLLEERVKQMFLQKHELLYIPAGRSLLATLSITVN